jgi:hypothetical protein
MSKYVICSITFRNDSMFSTRVLKSRRFASLPIATIHCLLNLHAATAQHTLREPLTSTLSER